MVGGILCCRGGSRAPRTGRCRGAGRCPALRAPGSPDRRAHSALPVLRIPLRPPTAVRAPWPIARAECACGKTPHRESSANSDCGLRESSDERSSRQTRAEWVSVAQGRPLDSGLDWGLTAVCPLVSLRSSASFPCSHHKLSRTRCTGRRAAAGRRTAAAGRRSGGTRPRSSRPLRDER